MKLMLKIGIVLTCLLSISVVVAQPFMRSKPMVVPQLNSSTGMTNPLFIKLDSWISQTLGVNEKFARNTDSIAGKNSHFVITQNKNSTLNVSKVIRIKNQTFELFSGRDFYLTGKAHHPLLPMEVVQYFQKQ